MTITSAGLNKLVPATGCTMALHTANPGDAGTVSEATGGGYARQACTFSAATGGSKVCTLSNQPVFTLAAGSYGWYSIRDGGGVVIDTGALTPAKTVETTGDQITITTGSISLS